MLVTALIAMLLSAPPTSQPDADVNAVAERELAKLPGRTGFAFCELTDNGPKLIYGVRQGDRFAIGSSFKLFILGALAAELNEHRREIDNVMRLQAELLGPPHSEMADWPAGSPVTLHTLALKMISISDNTATDHLHYLLDRQRIEQQMETMIGSHAAWNTPLLNTREMTMLRDKNTGLLGQEYAKLDDTGKRVLLTRLDQGIPDYESLDFDAAAYPLAEWYATPIDMAHALAWLQKNTHEKQPAHPLRAILAVDPKLPHDATEWPFVGFKGGSEDQLLAGNWLLHHKNGHWYTLEVFYNNPDGRADQEQTIAVIKAIFDAIGASLK